MATTSITTDEVKVGHVIEVGPEDTLEVGKLRREEDDTVKVFERGKDRTIRMAPDATVALVENE